MLKSSTEAHLASQSKLVFVYWPTVEIQETLIEGTRQANEDLPKPTIMGITHCAIRPGYTTNYQWFWAMHAANP